MESTNLLDIALLNGMKKCHIHDPEKRASARLVLDYLNAQYDAIDSKYS